MPSTCVTWTSIALAAALSAASNASTLLVPSEYPTIQAAINAATNGDEVIVADGVYTGAGNTDLTLAKAITVRSATGAAHCTIDGNLEFSAFWTGPDVGPDTVIAGFTIKHCFNIPAGGGMALNGSPTVRDCVFTDCYGWNYGGAIFVSDSDAEPTIERCVFADNYVDAYGGAIAVLGGNPKIIDCIFSANVGLAQGGIYIYGAKATITNCSFVGNLYSAIYIQASSNATTIVNCLFSGNEGFGVQANGLSPSIVNCTFVGNVGAAIAGKATVVNSILVDSVSESGVPLQNQVFGTLANFTINSSDVEGGWTGPGANNINADPLFTTTASGSWTLAPFYDIDTNTTVYTNANASFVPGALARQQMNPDTAQQRHQYIAANTATTISVYGNFLPSDDFTGFPNLVVDASDSYTIFNARPSAGSPVIDAGNNAAPPRSLLFDLDGNARFIDDPKVRDTGLGRAPLIDMGAYERQVPSSADLNGDGAVNATDLGILLGAWGSSGSVADIDGDGIVGAPDLALLLGAWTG